MGIRPTKFGTAKFGTSEFGADYPSKYWEDAITDFKDIMMEWSRSMRLYREDTRELDSMGRKKNVELSDHDIFVLFQPITSKERHLVEQGYSVQGSMIAYLWSEYEWGRETLEPQVGDILYDTQVTTTNGNPIRWRIEKIIQDRTVGYKKLYKKVLVYRLDEEE